MNQHLETALTRYITDLGAAKLTFATSLITGISNINTDNSLVFDLERTVKEYQATRLIELARYNNNPVYIELHHRTVNFSTEALILTSYYGQLIYGQRIMLLNGTNTNYYSNEVYPMYPHKYTRQLKQREFTVMIDNQQTDCEYETILPQIIKMMKQHCKAILTNETKRVKNLAQAEEQCLKHNLDIAKRTKTPIETIQQHVNTATLQNRGS
jgi:hypothetical protein